MIDLCVCDAENKLYENHLIPADLSALQTAACIINTIFKLQIIIMYLPTS